MKPSRYILLLALFLPACASMPLGHYNTYQTAQTLPKGKSATGIGIGALNASLPADSHVFLAFFPEGWFRYGASERAEIGFRAYANGLSFEAKMLLNEGGPDKPSIAIAPGLGYSRMEAGDNDYYEVSWGILGSLPLIISVPLKDGNAVYFGPKLQYMFSAESGYSKDIRTTFVGGFFGVAIKKGKVVYMPEISFFSYSVRYTYENWEYGYGYVEETMTQSGDIIFPGLGISMAF